MTEGRKKIIKYLQRLGEGGECFDEFMACSIDYVGYVVYKNLSDKSFLGDAVNETYRNVIRYIHSLKPDGNPIAWLCKIAQNEAYKINARILKRNEELVDDIEESRAFNDCTDSVLQVIDLYRAIERLDETDRKIIEYIFFEEKKYKDISSELGISVSDITHRKKSALKKLLKFLSD